MNIPYYHVDVFTSNIFSGNPAGVCVLENWLDEDLMQNIATENNLSETAFIVFKNDHYQIRWFTPTSEINLCGHATLASGFVVFNFLGHGSQEIIFHSHISGKLSVGKNDELYTLNFPSIPSAPCELSEELTQTLGHVSPIKTLKADDYLVVFEHEKDVLSVVPNFEKMKQLDGRGVIVTSKGSDCDFVSRYFCPKFGVNEDPVTGSTHCTLIPYWSKVLSKNKLSTKQLSKRGGELFCEDLVERVNISGEARCYMKGQITA